MTKKKKREGCSYILNKSFVTNLKILSKFLRSVYVVYIKGCLFPIYWRKVNFFSNKLLEHLLGVSIPMFPSPLSIQETLINLIWLTSITKITHFLIFTESCVLKSDYRVKQLARGHFKRTQQSKRSPSRALIII